MSFTMNNLSQIHVGGGQGNSIWHYYSASDNVASFPMGTVNTTYFQAAYTTHGVLARKGDIIHCVYCATNSASMVTVAVPDNWDSNGASVIAIDQG